MKFICLKYWNHKQWGVMFEAERQKILQDSKQFAANLREAGPMYVRELIMTDPGAVSLHRSQGQLIVDDFASHQDFNRPASIIFLEARDLNHAIILLADHPALQFGSLTIYPIDRKEDMQ